MRSPLKQWGKRLTFASRATVVVAAAALLCGLSACGQKGPLYLPQPGGDATTNQTSTPSGS